MGRKAERVRAGRDRNGRAERGDPAVSLAARMLYPKTRCAVVGPDGSWRRYEDLREAAEEVVEAGGVLMLPAGEGDPDAVDLGGEWWRPF